MTLEQRWLTVTLPTHLPRLPIPTTQGPLGAWTLIPPVVRAECYWPICRACDQDRALTIPTLCWAWTQLGKVWAQTLGEGQGRSAWAQRPSPPCSHPEPLPGTHRGSRRSRRARQAWESRGSLGECYDLGAQGQPPPEVRGPAASREKPLQIVSLGGCSQLCLPPPGLVLGFVVLRLGLSQSLDVSHSCHHERKGRGGRGRGRKGRVKGWEAPGGWIQRSWQVERLLPAVGKVWDNHSPGGPGGRIHLGSR